MDPSVLSDGLYMDNGRLNIEQRRHNLLIQIQRTQAPSRKTTDSQTIIQNQLKNIVSKKYSIKNDFYHVKHVNDIIFHNTSKDNESMIFEEDKLDQYRSKDVHQVTGKLLTAVFKDYLIYDDIFEFFNRKFTREQSCKVIKEYADHQRQIAVTKYGWQLYPWEVEKQGKVPGTVTI